MIETLQTAIVAFYDGAITFFLNAWGEFEQLPPLQQILAFTANDSLKT